VDLVFFVLLVGALVLVHELGHFVAARLFGVKVLTFSLGFGPAIVKLRGRETTYQLGLLPFGGFVKLLQEPARNRTDKEPSVSIAPEDRPRTYEAQPLVRRALIALAGPMMNLVVPVFLFFAVFLEPSKQLPPTIGLVVAGSPAHGLLFPGDRVLSIDGAPVDTYADVHAKISHSPGAKLTMRVARFDPVTKAEKTVDVVVVPRAATETRELGVTQTVGRLGVGAAPVAAAIGVPSPSSPAARAGLRTFDVITHVGGAPTPRFVDLERRLRENLGTSVPVNYLRPSALPVPEGSPLLELAVYEARVAVLTPEIPAGAEGDDLLARTGIEPTDLYAASVPEGSSEWRAGLRPGDRMRTIDAVPVQSWQAMVEDLIAGGDRTREVGYSREGKLMTGVLRVRKEEWVDTAGQHVERHVFRTTHWTPMVPPPLVDEPAPVRTAMRRALGETAHVVRFLASGAVRLVQGKLTVRAISGPITIYDVAARAGARGARDFLWVMALISINLGLLNLLPIPTLDGGQLLFLGVEGVTRRPVPIRAREMLSFLGFLMLVGIMILAVVNDLRR
jgi:regulator of sigma E protease